MSRRGQLSLQRVIVDYSTYGPADGLRHAFAREIPQFKKEFPNVVVEVRPRAKAAAVTGVYRDGSERSFHVSMLSSQGIYVRLHQLAQTCNDRTTYFNNGFQHYQRRSVQGSWNPYLWLAERHEQESLRKPKPLWDRKLSDAEWDYYVDKYSQRMKDDRHEIQQRVEQTEVLPKKVTDEIADRWKKFVTPNLQTDVEHNISLMKKQAAKGVAPADVSWDEYRLFTAPDYATGGEDVMRGLKHKEMAKVEKWWEKREEQLKPPK